MASVNQALQVDRSMDFYGYTVDIASIAAAATVTQTFSIDTDSNFVLQKMTQESDISGAAVTTGTEVVPLCKIQVQDGGSSRQMFSQPVSLHGVFGTGENPFILPAPRLFSAGSTVTITVTNYSAATTYHIVLHFLGLKKYLGQ